MSDDTEYSASNKGEGKSAVVVKIGMIGDQQIGKTALMVKYVEGKFNEDYIETLGKIDLIKKGVTYDKKRC
jgi:GTP-binding protein of the ras superfamily involved in termination of M-phase